MLYEKIYHKRRKKRIIVEAIVFTGRNDIKIVKTFLHPHLKSIINLNSFYEYCLKDADEVYHFLSYRYYIVKYKDGKFRTFDADKFMEKYKKCTSIFPC